MKHKKIIVITYSFIVMISIAILIISLLGKILPDISLKEVFLEAIIVMHPLIWIFILPQIIIHKSLTGLILVGCTLYFSGVFIDLLDEIFAFSDILALLEELSEIIGLLLITYALYQSYHFNLQHLIKVKKDAITDPLTKLYNRRFLLDEYRKTLRLNYNTIKPITIAFIDIDNFKICNDKLGHDKGDFLIKKISKTLLALLRDKDYAFRYGGEEFIIILSRTSIGSAFKTMERIRAKHNKFLKTLNIKYKTKFTLSIGIAQYLPKLGLEKCINNADLAMYEAKKKGKDRVVVFKE